MIRSSRIRRSLLAFLLGSLAQAPMALAELSASKIHLPSGPASVSGLGRNFVPSLASGTASYGIEITVPPAAGGLRPSLSLDYDGGSGVSEFGLGFRLSGIPSIRVRTENGLPRFDGSEEFEAVGLGGSGELVELAGGYFRSKIEQGGFTRLQRGKDGRTWEARTKAGRILRFGGEEHLEADGRKIVTFLLREELDLYGHKISYEWDFGSGRPLLSRVVWNDFSPVVRQELILSYEDRPDTFELHSSGIRQLLTKRATKIEVKLGGELVRRYELSYEKGATSRLASVKLVGSDGKTALPAASFEYSSFSFATEGQVISMKGAPTQAPTGDRSLVDLNGDALPDFLVATSGAYRSYINHDGASWLAPKDWSIAESPSVSLAEVGASLADIDGDSNLDVVLRSGTTSFKYFSGRGDESFAASTAMTPVPSLALEDPNVRLADMDGDRRSDIVATTPSGLQIAYNLGGGKWSGQVTVGPVSKSEALLFSDGKTQICEVNGDHVADICFLRSGTLNYFLGLGFGKFTEKRSAKNVPSFEENEPYRLLDLNGDGLADLVRVGVSEVAVALAETFGSFGDVRKLSGTPTNGAGVVVEFSDMNASGTIDVVWVDPTANSNSSWKYLELFPKGRAGLLTRIENGLGKVTSIEYEPAAKSAARARDAKKPWTTRMNVAMPVVKRYSVSSSLGDPDQVWDLEYENGTWDAVDRTFAGFGGGREFARGDEFTPTLVTESVFDTGVARRSLRGSVLSALVRDETGYIFSRTGNVYKDITFAGLDSDASFSYLASTRKDVVEGKDESRLRSLLVEYAQDEFGNVTEERNYGEVKGEDFFVGNDERLTVRTFAKNEQDWLVGFVATEELRDGNGNALRRSRNYYDGAAFEGLPLREVARGNLTRQEEWLGPGEGDYELDTATKYNDHGQPVETKDARGGGRFFAWDEDDHTSILSETVKLESKTKLVESAKTDRRFGEFSEVSAFDGGKTKFAFDALGRLEAIYRPGDAESLPTTRYSYELGSPLSRIVTTNRFGTSESEVERGISLVDGLGRTRGNLSEDRGKWVLAGVGHLDARGEVRRTLHPRGIDDPTKPPLLEEAAGISSYRDASGRELRTQTDLGYETRKEYAPLVVRSWDAGQNDPTSPYEHTPEVTHSDGLGRLVKATRTLGGEEWSATFEWDAAGELVRRTDPEGAKTSYEYDRRGRRTKVIDADAGTREFFFDALGNVTKVKHADGTESTSRYDLASRILAEDEDGDGKDDLENVWDVSSDAPEEATFRGKLVSATDKSGSIYFEYDERGRSTKVRLEIDEENFETESRFDNLDREILHVYPDKSSLRLRRNGRGQLAGYGEAVEIDFYENGLEKERRFNTGVKQTTGHDTDLRPNEIHALDAKGNSIEHLLWELDGAGNVSGLRDMRSKVSAKADRSESYEYDNFYRLTGARGSWGKSEWFYSANGNLLERKGDIESTASLKYTYGDSARPHAPTKIGERTIKYDGRGRIERDGVRTYSWSGADELRSVEGAGSSRVENVFDAAGSRRKRIETKADGTKSTTVFLSPWEEVKDGKLSRYIVHVDRRIARLADSNGTGAGVAGVRSFEVPPSARTPFIFAAMFFLFALSLAIFGARKFEISKPFLPRFSRTFVSFATLGVSLSVPVLLVACGGSSGNSLDLEGSVKTISEADTLLFVDQRGTLLSETDGLGKRTGEFNALPFGIARTDTASETRKYAGAPRDTSINLDHMSSRFYAPDLGIWTASDPVHFTDPERLASSDFTSANPYAYANQNPIIGADDDGEFPHIAVGAFIGGVVGGGMEAVRQYRAEGKITDWGKVGGAAAGGAVSGALTAAVPGSGLLGVAASNGFGSAVGGVVDRAVSSGGKDLGTLNDIKRDATVGAAMGVAGKFAGKVTSKVNSKPSVPPAPGVPKVGVKSGGPRAGHNGVQGPVHQTARTTRSGDRAIRQTFPDGSVKDISPKRVKEFVPNTHPNAPAGSQQKVKFDNPQPGTKGYKRDPTPSEKAEL